MLNNLKKAGLWFFKSFIWLGILVFVLDIVTKSVVVHYMVPGQRIDLIPGFLGITYTVNTNAAFGIGIPDNPLANRIIYIVIATIVCGIILFLFIKKFKRLNKYYRACIMLVFVGAFGNLIDRIFYTPSYLKNPLVGVVDWIDFYGVWKFIFNVADISVVVGVIMLVVYLIVDEVRQSRKNKKAIQMKKDVISEASKVANDEVNEIKTEETPKVDLEENKK